MPQDAVYIPIMRLILHSPYIHVMDVTMLSW